MLVLLIAIVWTDARGTWIALLAALFVFAGTTSRMVRIVIVASAALTGIAFATVPALWTLASARGTSFRLDLWAFYLKKAVEHPWLGYGAFAYIPVKLANGQIVDQPHNLILWGQIYGGIGAAAAVTMMLAVSIYWAYRYWREERNITPLLLIVTMSVFGIFEVGLLSREPDATWVTFWLPIAICAGAEMRVRRPAREPLAAAL